MAIDVISINAEQSKKILGLAESHFCDLKSIDIAPAKLTKSISAFSNADGGELYIGIDEDKVIPDKSLSVYEGAVACWKGESMGEWREWFIKAAVKFDFPVHRAYNELTKNKAGE